MACRRTRPRTRPGPIVNPRAAQKPLEFRPAARAPSFFHRRTARAFFPLEVRRNFPGTPKYVAHATDAWGVAFANRFFWRHHVVLSVHEGAARHMKLFAAVNDCHK